jgi:hypothetical protein
MRVAALVHLVLGAALAGMACAGCAQVGANPLSIALHETNAAFSHSVGMANAGVITPAEKAKYDGASCAELKQLIDNYRAAADMTPNAPVKNNAADKKAMAALVITTRLDYLQRLYVSRKC